ncbi:MAG: hypothetical protein M1834_005438 [Cirrosporium novae-zelandiae]|nr:MAG: hypothetical protein M1834_005438 [Cirrosporium novae-zelandiae]
MASHQARPSAQEQRWDSPQGDNENSPPLLLRGQKRPREAEDPINHIPTERPQKRPRSLPADCSLGQTFGQEVASVSSASWRGHVRYWAEECAWPKDFYQDDDQQDNMDPLLARRKSMAFSPRRSEASFAATATPSHPLSERVKSALYKQPHYVTELEIQGDSHMKEYELGITDTSKSLCQTLLEKEQPAPKDTLFRDDKTFRATCARLQNKNEARLFKDITPLIVPSAESLAIFGAKHLDIVVESVNEGWNNCMPVTTPRPQPDFSVGFARSAFSDDQLSKLQPFIGDTSCLSYFRATYFMYFPFLTCEVKCGNTGLEIADRQNAHSMTVAMKGVVALFRRVGREQELHREILGFSLSHNHDSVRIWGHYPVIDGAKTTFWHCPIRKFDFTEQEGKEKWTAYTITKNIYDVWMPDHFKRLSSAVDDLQLSEPSGLPQQFGLSQQFGLPQQFENQSLEQEPDSQSSHIDLQPITPDTSTRMETPSPKKRKG